MKKFWAILYVYLLGSAVAVYAQFETAEVLGTVHDSGGGSIPGAAVTLTNPETGIRTTVVTDELGNYDFFSVKVGRYNIEVEANGFSKASIPGISVSVNARQRADVIMQVGTISETVQ